MMRVKLTVIHSFPIWLPQTQTWMYNQVKYLPKNIDTHIVCERTEHLDQFQLLNIHSLQSASRILQYWEWGLRMLGMRHLLMHLPFVARKTNAQLIHSHFGHIGWIDSAVAQKLGIKHVVTFYGADVGKLPAQDKKWLFRYCELFDKADAFLCEGPFMASELMKLGCPEEKVRVHHLGIEVKNIPFMPRSWKSGEPLRILIAATFREKKGIPDALRALAILQQEVPLEITIIGDAGSERSSRAEKQLILQLINDLGLASKTRLLGLQPYSVFFREAYENHIFISPSVTASDGNAEGGAPVSIIEMMATGMPVVSTSHCDIPEVVQYGIDRWLVDEHDVNGLVNRIQWLIQNPGQWTKFLSAGRNHVETHFHADEQGKKLAAIYQSILG